MCSIFVEHMRECDVCEFFHQFKYITTCKCSAISRAYIKTIQTCTTYQKASTKNFPALFNVSSSTCCVLLMNLTFRGLNNIAPSPNIGGPPAENASACLIVVVISRMEVHIIIVKKEYVIFL